jgi:uncharacterized protein YegL
MPRLADTGNLETHQLGGSNFQFSAARIQDLGASEYTLGLIVVDDSPSVGNFKVEIIAALKEVVKACRRSPRADNMMLRVLAFSRLVDEVHGFKPLPDCNESDYDDLQSPGGSTSLFDATLNAVQSVSQYAKDLAAQDFDVNACVFVLTDGWDNSSTSTANMVADAVNEARRTEALESIMLVLIGVNLQEPSVKDALDDFRALAGFQQFIALDNAEATTLAKLGGFISQSISSQSQALGTGGASQSLSF